MTVFVNTTNKKLGYFILILCDDFDFCSEWGQFQFRLKDMIRLIPILHQGNSIMYHSLTNQLVRRTFLLNQTACSAVLFQYKLPVEPIFVLHCQQYSSPTVLFHYLLNKFNKSIWFKENDVPYCHTVSLIMTQTNTFRTNGIIERSPFVQAWYVMDLGRVNSIETNGSLWVSIKLHARGLLHLRTDDEQTPFPFFLFWLRLITPGRRFGLWHDFETQLSTRSGSSVQMMIDKCICPVSCRRWAWRKKYSWCGIYLPATAATNLSFPCSTVEPGDVQLLLIFYEGWCSDEV